MIYCKDCRHSRQLDDECGYCMLLDEKACRHSLIVRPDDYCFLADEKSTDDMLNEYFERSEEA